MKNNNTDAGLKKLQNIVAIVLVAVAALLIILRLTHLCHSFPCFAVGLPLMAVLCLVQAWLNRRTDKGVAIFSAVAGLAILVCTLIRMF